MNSFGEKQIYKTEKIEFCCRTNILWWDLFFLYSVYWKPLTYYLCYIWIDNFLIYFVICIPFKNTNIFVCIPQWYSVHELRWKFRTELNCLLCFSFIKGWLSQKHLNLHLNLNIPFILVYSIYSYHSLSMSILFLVGILICCI